ncbi:glycosyltransferase [Amycolatopsis sp. SID8362]|nr:glycosyltransferase [Amycolatopsis sp. SID8362]NED48489.1 glycosyltransferase family 4 protein [Amycolatopsis sp. SID8362]
MVVRSLVTPEAGAPDPGRTQDLVIDVGGKPATQNGYRQLTGPIGRAKKLLRSRVPFQYDHLRQLRTDVVERRKGAHQLPRHVTAGGNTNYRRQVSTARPAILFGLHWLELGGAERWALDCVQLAKELGFVSIVVTDRESNHPWITRPEFEDTVVVPLTHPIRLGTESALFGGLFSAFDIRGVHVHHNSWLYDRLPWVKSVWPDVPVVDSQHILEWRTGGFVDHAVRMSALIDTHHVISPQLRDYLVHQQGVAAGKVVLATLAGATTAGITPDAEKTGPFTVTYIGRFHQQKRPQVFLKLAAELKKSSPVPARFIVHGAGELEDEIHELRDRLRLADVLEVRGPGHPVKATLAESDVLVVSSENEGLTLTTFEATAARIPVVSADVGSQASVVAEELLCPRHPYAFVRQAAEQIRTMMSSPEQHKRWLEEQAAKNEAFAKLPRAEAWARELYQEWKK